VSDAIRRLLARPGARERLERRARGTRLGVEARVAPGWTEYREGNAIEQHAREVHYDVLRREGFDRQRAREIAAESSERQAEELARIRGDRLVVSGGSIPEGEPRRPGCGLALPSALTDEG